MVHFHYLFGVIFLFFMRQVEDLLAHVFRKDMCRDRGLTGTELCECDLWLHQTLFDTYDMRDEIGDVIRLAENEHYLQGPFL